MSRLLIGVAIFVAVLLSLGVLLFTPSQKIEITTYDVPSMQVPYQEQDESITIVYGDRESEGSEVDASRIRKFIERYFSNSNPTGPNHEVIITLDNVPLNLNTEVPLPGDAVVLGSMSWGEDRHQIVADTWLEPEEVFAFYENELQKHSYELWELPSPRGFQSSYFDMQRTFCNKQLDLELRVTAAPVELRATDLRIYLTGDEQFSQCDQEIPNFSAPGNPYGTQLPSLRVPQGAIMEGGGSGGGQDEWNSHSTLKTEMNSDELLRHYEEQLLVQNWTLIESGVSTRFHWSTWSFEDEDNRPWDGFLFVHQDPNRPDKRFVMLQIVRIK